MRGQYFYSRGNHLSALLKEQYHHVRQAHPERYGTKRVEETRMDGDGKVTVKKVLVDRGAVPASPRQRHALAHDR